MECRPGEFLWTEKYRPSKIADVIAPKDTKDTFLAYVKQGNIPNLLLWGPPGTGKTTLAKAVCEELGCEYYFINASLKRNVDTLRNEVLEFATSVSFTGGRKVIIMDEADNLNTISFQPPLRGVFEQTSKNCGYILTCNFPDKIIEPILSRLTLVSFRPPQGNDAAHLAAAFFGRAMKILDHEGVQYDRQVLIEIVNRYFPDWRKALSVLQNAATKNKSITAASLTLPQTFDDLVTAMKSKSWAGVNKWVRECEDPQATYSTFLRSADKFTDGPASSAQLAWILGTWQHRAVGVADQELNLIACLCEVMSDVKWK